MNLHLLSLLAMVLGIVYVTYVRVGDKKCYIFGALQISVYIYLAYTNQFYGDVMFNTVSLLLQPIGWVMWSKSNNVVKERKRLDNSQLFKVFIVWLFLIMMLMPILNMLNGRVTIIDATTTASSITGLILSIRAYREQWIFWIICNSMSIVLWLTAFMSGGDGSLFVIGMWIAYLTNSLVAVRQWYKKEEINVGIE